MNLKKTVIASAVLLATGSVFAYEMPELPTKFDNEVVQTNDTNQNSGLTDFDGVGIVKPMQGNNGAGSPSFMYGNGEGVELTNKGDIWVVAGDLGKDGSYGNYANGMIANNGATATNNGTIYVKSEAKFSGGTPNYSGAKGMTSDGQGTIINNGTIVVDGGVAMNVGTTADHQTVTNSGTIIVKEGYGIAFNREKTEGTPTSVEITNGGNIVLEGENTYGVVLDQSLAGGTFKNTGSITGDGVGIVAVTSENLTIEMSGDSHITADMMLNSTTTLVADNLNNAETININTAGTINVIGSALTVMSMSDAAPLSVGEVNTDKDSKTTFKLSRMGAGQEKVLDITTVTGEGDVNVGYTGNVSDELAGGADEANLFSGVNLGGQALEQVSVDEGIYGDGAVYIQNADGSVVKTTTSTNSLLTSAHDLAMANAYMWRSELSSLSDRMGTLRTLPETAGAWARYAGGSFDGDDFTHDYNTIEIGADMSVGKNFLIGMSFDYTQGESDLVAGSADSDNYSVGFYGSYFNDNGCFLDAMFKIGSVDVDYKLNNGFAEEGDYTLTGVIFGIETGHRWTVNNWFIEPQVQLTYSNLASDSYRTNLREVSFDTMESLIARVGVMSGLTFAQDKGSAYAKVSYNHDFLGDVEGDFTTDGVTRTFKDELDDNWGEASLGMNYRVNDSVNTFVDVGCTFGGDIDQDWRVNLGARYMF